MNHKRKRGNTYLKPDVEFVIYVFVICNILHLCFKEQTE
jgi:hypothetical protein